MLENMQIGAPTLSGTVLPISLGREEKNSEPRENVGESLVLIDVDIAVFLPVRLISLIFYFS